MNELAEELGVDDDNLSVGVDDDNVFIDVASEF
jgi:hypothetical protein